MKFPMLLFKRIFQRVCQKSVWTELSKGVFQDSLPKEKPNECSKIICLHRLSGEFSRELHHRVPQNTFCQRVPPREFISPGTFCRRISNGDVQDASSFPRELSKNALNKVYQTSFPIELLTIERPIPTTSLSACCRMHAWWFMAQGSWSMAPMTKKSRPASEPWALMHEPWTIEHASSINHRT